MNYTFVNPRIQVGVSVATISIFVIFLVFYSQVLIAIRNLNSYPTGNFALEVADGNPPASIGNLKVIGRSVYFHASLDFVAVREGFYPNIMQTDDGNEGIRVELADRTLMIMAGKGKSQNFTLPLGQVEFGRKYHLQIEGLDRSHVSAKFGDHPWQSIVDSAIRVPGENFRVGDGHVQARRWQGDIENFQLEVKNTLSPRRAVLVALALLAVLLLPLIWVTGKKRALVAAAIRLSIEAAMVRGPSLRLPSVPSTFPLWILALIAAGITAVYTASYAFVYFPITEGWFNVYADAIKRGQILYKDVNLLLTPVFPLTLLALDKIFGDGFWGYRLLGIVLMAAFAAITFDLLRSIFDRWASAFAAAVAVIFYESGPAFIDYDFTQIVSFFLLAGCLAVIRYSRSCNPFSLFLSGFFFSLATLTKQSNGGVVSIGMTLIVFTTIFFVARRSLISHLAMFFLGALLPLSVVLTWLAQNGSLFAFLEQTIFNAASAKGSSAIASGWIWRFFGDPDFAGANLAAAEMVVKTVVVAFLITVFVAATKSAFVAANSQSKSPEKVFVHSFLGDSSAQPLRWNPRALAAVVGFFLLVATVFGQKLHYSLQLSFNLPIISIPNKYNLTFLFVIIAVNVYCVAILVALVRLSIRKNERLLALLIVGCFGLLLMAGNGTSAALSEMSAFLGIGILIAAGMSITSRSAIIPTFVMLLAVSGSGSFISAKFSNPYTWWGFSTGEIGTSTCSPLSGKLEGLCIDEGSAKGIANTVAAVSSSTDRSAKVLSFPNIPIFALLADRTFFGRSPVPWFDFMSQKEGDVLLGELITDPPEAIVVARLPVAVFDGHEKAFNHGEPGVHRKILQYIDELWRQEKIALVTENMIDGVNVQVFRLVTNPCDECR
ncbi:glycosyltransferase family 39 protein [Rhizobium sp. SAFR-030]|uniref:glycosyltransferase family 39 protein n=1 Tax=Rhizobium sp. SAFR-030 TaxID=3387277 RepID=UPI003F80C05D